MDSKNLPEFKFISDFGLAYKEAQKEIRSLFVENKRWNNIP
jgi:hypothetical protein